MKKTIPLLLIALLALPFSLQAAETEVTLAWDGNNPAPFGYQIFCREEGQAYDYSDPRWEGDDSFTQCTIDQLDDTKVYYFVVRAVDESLNQSGDSNEVRYPSTDGSDSDGSRSLGGDGGGGMSGSSCFIQSLTSP